MSKSPNRFSPTLVVGSDHRIAIAIARCLSRHGVPVDIAVPKGVACRSAHIRKKHILNRLDDAVRVATDIAALADTEGYDTVLPTNDLSLAAISQQRHLLSGVAHLGCPSAEAVASVLSKDKSLALAEAINMAVPKTQLGAELDGPSSLKLRFPIIAKPVSKAFQSSVKVLYIRDEAEFAGFLSNWQGALHLFLFQQYVPGIGVGVEMLIHGDRAVAVFQHQREEELPATGGVSVLARAVSPNAHLVQKSRSLLDRLRWQGVAMVEYRYDPETQQATLMEVNGRYWGSLALSDAAGLEFPWYQWQLMHGIDPEVPATYRVGTRVAWTAGRVDRLLGYLVKRPPRWLYDSSPVKEIASFVKHLPPFARDAVWRLRDPLAPLSEIEQVVRRLLGRASAALTKFRKLLGHGKLLI